MTLIKDSQDQYLKINILMCVVYGLFTLSCFLYISFPLLKIRCREVKIEGVIIIGTNY